MMLGQLEYNLAFELELKLAVKTSSGLVGSFPPDLEYLWRYPKISGVQHRSDKPDSGRIFSATFQKNP
jgi:hypothetical protein